MFEPIVGGVADLKVKRLTFEQLSKASSPIFVTLSAIVTF